jgi:hypothetical protein
MATYQPGIPTGSVPLDQDYLNLQGNFQQLDTAFGYDHTPFSDTSGIFPPGKYGMHKAIHMLPVSTVATNPPNNQPINGYSATSIAHQIFSAQINDGINTDTALFSLTANGLLQQLTRNLLPKALQNGYTFLPGGLILQWGVIQGTHGSGKVFQGGDTSGVGSVPAFTYTGAGNINFPSAVYAVWTTLFYSSSPSLASGTSGTVSILNSNGTPTAGLTFPLTGFIWQYTGNSNSYTYFMWFALGS